MEKNPDTAQDNIQDFHSIYRKNHGLPVDFFLPVKDKSSKELAEINKNISSVYKWNDEKCAYISNVLRFNEKRVNIESILYKILLDYLKENKTKWENYFSKREFYNNNLEKGFCYFSLRIILR